MKFFTRILAMLFVFAIPAVASAWEYAIFNEATDEEMQFAMNKSDSNLSVAVSCKDRILRVTLTLYEDDDETRYPKEERVNIITRFDQTPPFKMPWSSFGGEWNDSLQWVSVFLTLDVSSHFPENVTHWEKFLNGLRTSNRLQLRPEQQSTAYTTSLIGAKSPIDRVLRGCGRDDLIE